MNGVTPACRQRARTDCGELPGEVDDPAGATEALDTRPRPVERQLEERRGPGERPRHQASSAASRSPDSHSRCQTA